MSKDNLIWIVLMLNSLSIIVLALTLIKIQS